MLLASCLCLYACLDAPSDLDLTAILQDCDETTVVCTCDYPIVNLSQLLEARLEAVMSSGSTLCCEQMIEIVQVALLRYLDRRLVIMPLCIPANSQPVILAGCFKP